MVAVKVDDGEDVVGRIVRDCCGGEGGLPVFQDTVLEVIRAIQRPYSSASDVSRAILRDQGFTAKVLRLVNSAFYNPGGEVINTISRAVVMLGLDMIRSVTTGLAFVETFQRHHPAVDMKKLVADSFVAATMAREFASAMGGAELEAVYVEALLYNLGPMAVAYSMPHKYATVRRLMERGGMEAEQAQVRVLGLPFSKVGLAVGREMNLPETILETMAVSPVSAGAPRTRREKMAAVSALANAITANLSGVGTAAGLDTLMERLSAVAGIPAEKGEALIESAYLKVRELAEPLSIEVGKFRPVSPPAQEDSVTLRTTVLRKVGAGFEAPPCDDGAAAAGGSDGAAAVRDEPDAAVKMRYLQDISQLIFEKQELSVIFNTIIEGLHRAVGFERVILLLCDGGKRRIVGRYGLGVEKGKAVRDMVIENDPRANIFGRAFRDRSPVLVADTGDAAYRRLVPHALRRLLAPAAFAISPIHSRGSVIGFFYADRASTGRPISPDLYQAFLHFTLQGNIALDHLMARRR
ncbi:MAG TPA: HDOD domain-containing protein [Deltaproteobacteria bacterium]|nr:HDOD domain-containing protein [Deltaproteobacteria bacterium]